MPIFTTRHGHTSGVRDDFSYEELRGWSGSRQQTPLRSQSSALPVQICVSNPVTRAPHVLPRPSTSELGDTCSPASILPIPPFETIQRGFAPILVTTPGNTSKPLSYNPRWEPLPLYPTTGSPHNGSRLTLDTILTSYLARTTAMVLIAVRRGALRFNSHFLNHRVIQQTDLEEGNCRNGYYRMCGMSVGRTDLAINLSLFALYIFIFVV